MIKMNFALIETLKKVYFYFWGLPGNVINECLQ